MKLNSDYERLETTALDFDTESSEGSEMAYQSNLEEEAFRLTKSVNSSDVFIYSYNLERHRSLSHQHIYSCAKFVKSYDVFEDKEIFSVEVHGAKLCGFKQLCQLTCKDEVLLRTFFHQIISGVEYIHNKNVSHMNISPDTLVVGDDYNLKLIDFSEAFKTGDSLIISQGSKNFKAPEMIRHECKKTNLADIYSVGIIFFSLIFNSIQNFEFLYSEDNNKNYSMEDMIKYASDNLESLLARSSSFKDMLNLIILMTKSKPEERITIQAIQQNKWFRKPIYSHEKLKSVLKAHKI